MPALAKHYAGELQSWHLVRNPREKAVSRALAADRARQATAHPKAGPTAVLTVRPAAVLLMGAALRAIVHPEAARLTGETVKAVVLLMGAALRVTVHPEAARLTGETVKAAVLIIKADSIAAAEIVANAMAAQGAALGIAGAVTTGAATTVSGRLGTLMQEAGVMLAASSAGV